MTREMSVILLGVAVVVIPYLGVPSAGRTFLLVLAGLTLIVIGLLLRAQSMARSGRHAHSHTFIEHDAERGAHDHTHEHKEGITSLN